MKKQIIFAEQKALEMIRKNGEWKVEAPNKMVRAISKGGWYILHLQEGTVRNETCAKEFVKYLNELEKARTGGGEDE